jgi:RAB protein geranylgeranyltransferase component A
VLHLDPFPTYGGPRHSSLTIPELTTHLGSLPNSSSRFPASTSSDPAKETFQHQVENGSLGRQYALSLYPAVLPARGKLIDTLISSGVSGYVGFRIVDGVGLFERNDAADGSSSSSSTGKIKKVPSSKGQVFKDKSMSLLEKRKLMKMLMFVVNLDQDKSAEDPALQGRSSLPSCHENVWANLGNA